MQNLEGAAARSSQVDGLTQSNKLNKQKEDQLQEQKVPLIGGGADGALGTNLQGMVSISYMAGPIVKEEMMKFSRMVFRATRGKALTYLEDLSHEGQIDYAGYTDKQLRTVYVIIFQEGGTIRTQLKKICESFMGRQVEIPIAFGNKEIKDRIRRISIS